VAYQKENNMGLPKASGKSLTLSIFTLHSKRIGFLRATVGGWAMYLSIPLFVFLHFTVVVFMYRFLLAPAFGLKRLRTRDYIFFDRHQVSGLSWFDKVNCLFCAYANGTIKLMNDQLMQFAENKANPSFFMKILLWVYVPIHLFFLIVGLFFSNYVLAIIAKMLGLHRGSVRISKKELYEADFAVNRSPLQRKAMIFYTTIAKAIAFNLEQIESAWCPLKHIEREGRVLPPHHENFISRDDLELIRKSLETDGTVSPNKPKLKTK